MKKLPMKITDNNWESKAPFIKKYSKYVRNVEVVCGKHFLIIYRLLDFMPNILNLKISVQDQDDESNDNKLGDVDANLVKLIDSEAKDSNILKLDSLKVSNAEFFPSKFFLKFLNVKNLQTFCFYNDEFEDDFTNDILIPFICQQVDLKHLELKVQQINNIFSPETIDKMNFKLKVLKIDQMNLNTSDYTYLNKFLLKQSETLEELRVFAPGCKIGLNNQVLNLQNLKKLTTFGLMPCFNNEEENEEGLMPKLEYLQFYRKYGFSDFENVDTTCLPNLQSMDIKCSVKMLLTESELGHKLTINPLKNLVHLKSFGVEFEGINCLNYLSSPNLEKLVLLFENFFFKTESWTQIVENLPNLQYLVIKGVDDEDFLDFIIEHIEDLLYLTDNDRLKVLKLHFEQDDLEIFFKNRKVTKCIGFSCEKYSQLFCTQELIRKKFKNFDFTLLTKKEFGEKYENLTMDKITEDELIQARLFLFRYHMIN